jgi:hypothetical protein
MVDSIPNPRALIPAIKRAVPPTPESLSRKARRLKGLVPTPSDGEVIVPSLPHAA